MTYRAVCGVLLLATVPVAGCGTATNLVRTRPEDGGRSPFGGVRHDVQCIEQAATGDFGPKPGPVPGPVDHPRMALMFLSAVDLPFSLIGDIVTWPYTAAYARVNEPIPVPPAGVPPVYQVTPPPPRPGPIAPAAPAAGTPLPPADATPPGTPTPNPVPPIPAPSGLAVPPPAVLPVTPPAVPVPPAVP